MGKSSEQGEYTEKKPGGLRKLMDFDVRLKREQLIKIVPLILYVTTLTMIYIANTYYAEKKLLELSNLTREIQELRSDYLTRKAEYMSKTKLSDVSKQIETSGLKELTQPQKKVTVREGEY